MNTYDIEFVKLLPHFMREDAAIRGLSKGSDEIVKAVKTASQMLTTWDKVYDMNHAELDALAWELNILWYDQGADLNTKRELVLNSDRVFQKLGTKWAVGNVIRTYFGEGHILEWFEYEGAPGHFRILSSNPSISDDKLSEFLNILRKVKRASAHLDGITITLSPVISHLYAGFFGHELTNHTYKMTSQPDLGVRESQVYGGFAVRQSTIHKYIMRGGDEIV